MSLSGPVDRRPSPRRRPGLTCTAILAAAGFMVLAVDQPAISAVPTTRTVPGAAPILATPVRAAPPDTTDEPSAPPPSSGPVTPTGPPPNSPAPTTAPTAQPTAGPSPAGAPPPPPPPDPTPVEPESPAAASPAAEPAASSPAAPVTAAPSPEIRPAGVVGPNRVPAAGSQPRFDPPPAGAEDAGEPPAITGQLVGTGWTSMFSGREAGFRIFIAGLIALIIALSGLVTVAVRRRPY